MVLNVLGFNHIELNTFAIFFILKSHFWNDKHPDTVGGILEHVRKLWPQANEVEVTLEANPGSVEAGRFAGYRAGGVNRISMGVQALNDRDLQRLGRIHTVSEAQAAFDIARKEFERVSFDLIYARQDQTLEDWKSELNQALSMAIDHLSLYQLTIEQGTAFGDRYTRGGLKGLPDEDRAADLYEATQEICEKAGFSGYEVSNYAKYGAESRHNLIYWRYGDYAGIGPGAHARVTSGGTKYAIESWRNPNKWLEAAEAGNAENARECLSGKDQAAEFLLMGLRLTEGVDLKRFSALADHPLDQHKIDELSDLGLLSLEDTQLRTTASGRMVLNGVLSELLSA